MRRACKAFPFTSSRTSARPPPPHVLLTALGACDAFVSHSSCDPPSLKFDALRRWAETETATTEGTTPRLWLDRLCLDAFASTVPLEITVPLLPIFAAGSRQMLALVGSSYPSRLWCVLEVFVFLQVRACPRHATTHPPMHTKDPSLVLTLLPTTSSSSARLTLTP